LEVGGERGDGSTWPRLRGGVEVPAQGDLGRFETITDADGTRTFLWDAAANGTGRLAQTTSADDVVVTYAYEPRGFLERETWTHDAQATQESFTVDLVHDALGRLEQVLYPEVPGRQRFVLKHVYDGATGELTRRDDATDPLAPFRWKNHADHARYHPLRKERNSHCTRCPKRTRTLSSVEASCSPFR
jgi:YD repeat-containing protein